MGEEEFEGVWAERVPASPARLIDFAIVGVDLLRHQVGAVEEALTGVMQLLCSHANHLTDQQAFADEARREIESIITEEG